MLRSYSQVMTSNRRQRKRIMSCFSGLALVLLLFAVTTTSHSASAFCMPRSRVRSLPAHTMVGATKERSQLEFEQRKEEDEEEGNEKMRIANGKSNNLHEKNGTDLKNGERKPQSLSALCQDLTAKEEDDSFEIHLGRALDTLRSDYQNILTEQPGELLISNQEGRVLLLSILLTDTSSPCFIHNRSYNL
jgi:hypothetical protein